MKIWSNVWVRACYELKLLIFEVYLKSSGKGELGYSSYGANRLTKKCKAQLFVTKLGPYGFYSCWPNE